MLRSRAHDPAQWFAKSREYMHSVKRRKPCLLSSAGILKTGSLSSAPPLLESPGVTVIWASPRFRHPHSQTLVIWASPVTLTLSLTQIGKVIWEENTHITRVLGMEMPKTRGCPHHCNTGNFSGRIKYSNPNLRIQIQSSALCFVNWYFYLVFSI